MKSQYILFAILGFAFLVRVAGIGYGLPLALHDDEQPFILAALKMLQLKTVLPVLHSAEFEPILPYLPYASYLYLPFFLVYIIGAAGWAWLTGAFPISALQNYLLSDLSPFFLMARFLNVVGGVLTVYFVYRAAKNLFSERTGLIAALFVSTSLLHVTMSMSARHWIWLGLIISAVLAVLTHQTWSFKKRYLWAAIIAGVGVGFNVLSVMAMALAGLLYVFYDIKVRLPRPEYGSRNDGLEHFFPMTVVKIGLIFVILAAISIALYPAGLGFGRDISVGATKSFSGAIAFFYEFLWPVAVSEPVLFGAALLGLIMLIIKREKFAWLALMFTAFYVLSFYFGFYYAHRFALGLFPIFAILAGYGLTEILKSLNTLHINYFGKIASQSLAMTILIIVALPLAVTLRLDYLALRGDSKFLARQWAEENIPAGEKVIVAGKRMRISTNKTVLAEQELIDPASIRKTELAEVSFERNPHGYKSFHALNLDAVGNENFYDQIGKYIKENGYKYLIVTPSDLTASRQKNFHDATRGTELTAFFGLPQEVYSLTKAQYKGWFGNLFRIREFGPTTAIYKFK